MKPSILSVMNDSCIGLSLWYRISPPFGRGDPWRCLFAWVTGGAWFTKSNRSILVSIVIPNVILFNSGSAEAST